MTKTCPICEKLLPIESFYPMKENAGRAARWQPYCIPCTIDIQRVRQLRSKYGLSLQEYNRMVEEQDDCCAICLKPERVVRAGRIVGLGVDHDHRTGDNRGLLCRGCNIGLGNFQDDPELLRNAASYVEYYNTLRSMATRPLPLKE